MSCRSHLPLAIVGFGQSSGKLDAPLGDRVAILLHEDKFVRVGDRQHYGNTSAIIPLSELPGVPSF